MEKKNVTEQEINLFKERLTKESTKRLGFLYTITVANSKRQLENSLITEEFKKRKIDFLNSKEFIEQQQKNEEDKQKYLETYNMLHKPKQHKKSGRPKLIKVEIKEDNIDINF